MIGIIGAMQHEIDLLISNLAEKEEFLIANFSFYKGKIEKKDVVIAKAGIGKVNASSVATILLLSFKCDLVISTGIAGGLAPLTTKNLVVGTKFSYGDVDVRAFGYKYGQIPGEEAEFKIDETVLSSIKNILDELNINYYEGLCLTSDSFITSIEQVKISSRIMCTEMESTAIVQICKHFRVPFLVLRFISDVIGEESQIENYTEFEEEMSNRSAEICLECVKRL